MPFCLILTKLHNYGTEKNLFVFGSHERTGAEIYSGGL